MKAHCIVINWTLSLCALSIDTETSTLWAVLLVVAYFALSTLLLVRAERKGYWKKQIRY